MKIRKKELLGLSIWFATTLCGITTASEGSSVWNYSQFSTPIRVLLHRSRGAVELLNVLPATVRIDSTWKAPKLSQGRLLFGAQSQSQLRMIRIPYKPVNADEIEMSVPEEPPGFLVNAAHYRGRMRLRVMNGELFLVNVLPLETYLKGTVGGEMNPSWPLEALKAQTVAARSYALYKMHHSRHALYDLENTTEDQVYVGSKGESPTVIRAVRETAGMYLAGDKGASIVHYHSRCGGETQSASAAWGATKSESRAVPCAFCRQNPYRWTASWSPQTFYKKLGLPFGLGARFLPARRSISGRVQEIDVLAGGQRHRITSEAARRLLGYENLKSTFFEIRESADEIRVHGVGAGHGVGMCQWGAKHLAERGMGFLNILRHYYPSENIARWIPAPPAQKNLDPHRLAGIGYAHARSPRLQFSATGNSYRPFSRLAP